MQEGRVYSWRTDKQFSWKMEQRPTFTHPKVRHEAMKRPSLSSFLSPAYISVATIQLLSAYKNNSLFTMQHIMCYPNSSVFI